MAKKPYPEKAKERIKATAILRKLQAHVLEDKEMTVTQINAAKILLAKCLPDQKAVEHSGGISTDKPVTLREEELDAAIERELAAAAPRKEAETKSKK